MNKQKFFLLTIIFMWSKYKGVLYENYSYTKLSYKSKFLWG